MKLSQAFLPESMAIMPLLPHFLPLLLLQFSSSFLITSAYSPPHKYFLNCGSKSDANFGLNRLFIGDAKPGPWPINPGKSKVVKNDTVSKSINEIYQTARVYNQPTWYVFGNITENGTYVVRLHFSALSSQNLLQARFNVSASCGFQLLSNFSLQNSDLNTPVVKEFVFELKDEPFGIQFSPLESSSLAFVNAIELFLAPPHFKPEMAYVVSAEARSKGNHTYDQMASEAFQAVYRVSMGGSLITQDNDTLWRTWLPDDGFMALPSPAKNVSFKENIEYKQVTTPYIAPTYVYSTAKALDMDTNGSSRDSNITWVFKVKKRTKYFVRLHFCNIIKQGMPFRFDYFLGVNRTSVDSNEERELDFATPFRYDYVVVTDGSGYFNAGIAHNKDAPFSRAFLNGLEIMELLEKSSVGPVDLKMKEEKQNQKVVIIGICVGGAVIVALIIGLALFWFIREKASPFASSSK